MSPEMANSIEAIRRYMRQEANPSATSSESVPTAQELDCIVKGLRSVNSPWNDPLQKYADSQLRVRETIIWSN